MRKYKIILVTGLLLMAAALFLAGRNLWEAQRTERESQRALESILQIVARPEVVSPAAEPDVFLEPDTMSFADRELTIKEVEGVPYIGLLAIPSQELQLPVRGEWDYQKLRLSACQYAGTPYARNFILCAHNYESHFGRLKELAPGDIILFADMEDDIFTYEVAEVSILPPTAIEMLMEPWDLSLFTCTQGGAARVVVRCNLVRYTTG